MQSLGKHCSVRDVSSSPPTWVTVSHKKIKPGHYRFYSTISPSLISLPLCCFSSSPANFEKKSQINFFLPLYVSLIPDLLRPPHPALTVGEDFEEGLLSYAAALLGPCSKSSTNVNSLNLPIDSVTEGIIMISIM